jgi:TatA/E family protein of Tat protein translocase
MFGVGGTEFLLILLFAFLIVGPEKMPQLGRTIGRAMRQFKNAQDEMNKVIRTEVYDPLRDNEPLKNPADILSGKSATEKKSVKTVSTASQETFAERKARLARARAQATPSVPDASTSDVSASSAAASVAPAATMADSLYAPSPSAGDSASTDADASITGTPVPSATPTSGDASGKEGKEGA